MARYPADDLARWLASVLEAAGVPADDASLGARVMIRADARGYPTHGLSRLQTYVGRLKDGGVTPVPLTRERVQDGVVYYDGNGGLGQIVATKAMAAGLKLARERAFVPVVLQDTGHLGAIGVFLLPAVEAGYFGFICQSAPPTMALPGSRGAAIGNSPLAFACPIPGDDPLVFDMGTSEVSRGKVAIAAREGKPIPHTWAIDADGNPTTDAAKAMAGAMLPLAGHEGIGLAMLIECLGGSLAGAPPIDPGFKAGPATAGLGHRSAFMLVINPARFADRSAFDAHLGAWVAYYKKASPTSRIPGHRAAAMERESMRKGVPVADAIVAEVRKVGDAAGRPFDVDPA
ncbi:MAG: Ldh family oxidoreductase [Rhodospirillales bacterium]|nr:Ldh family oxidoreductase [Rhodospirillales bacterium]